MDQCFWKKCALDPSSSGALSGLNWNTTLLTSEAETGLINQLLASSVNLHIQAEVDEYLAKNVVHLSHGIEVEF